MYLYLKSELTVIIIPLSNLNHPIRAGQPFRGSRRVHETIAAFVEEILGILLRGGLYLVHHAGQVVMMMMFRSPRETQQRR